MGGNEQYYNLALSRTTRKSNKTATEYINKEKEKVQKEITRCFKKYIVKRPNGNCQVLFALTELDNLVEEIMDRF